MTAYLPQLEKDPPPRLKRKKEKQTKVVQVHRLQIKCRKSILS